MKTDAPDQSMKSYKLISFGAEADFVEACEKALAEGWIPQGGVATTARQVLIPSANTGIGFIQWSQAFVRE